MPPPKKAPRARAPLRAPAATAEKTAKTRAANARFIAGQKVRAEVLGPEHVARARAGTNDIDAALMQFIVEFVWGSVWTRPGLDRRTRSLITMGILAALGKEELALHVRASRNTGVTRAQISELLLHVAVYAGIPAAHHAAGVAKDTLGEER